MYYIHTKVFGYFCLASLTDGTDHEVALAEEVAECDADEDGGDAAADEALPRLLGAELDEARPPHEEAEHVGHDVVDDHHHDGHDEPDEPLEHVLDDQVALSDHAEQGDVGPGEERELTKVVLLHQGENEPDEAEDVHCK